MPVSKIKNLILLILGMSVVCLLILVVPARLHQAQSEQELHAQLEALYASYDIELDRSILPSSIRLYAIELGAQSADSAAAAQALLGEGAVLQSDSTHFSSTYRSENGSCTFRSDGGFSASLEAGTPAADIAAASKKLLKSMGFETRGVSEPERQSAGVYSVRASQTILGVPVLSEGLCLHYTNSTLDGIEGYFYTGASQITRISEDACISCADALTAFLSRRDALGWVGSKILRVQQVYRHTESASASMRLSPAWIIVTDTGSFCVNGLSREVTVWEGVLPSAWEKS